MQINIDLSIAQQKALEWSESNYEFLIQSMTIGKANVNIDKIVQLTVQKCLENNIQIPSSKDEMVELAFTQNWVETAANKTPPITLGE